ncbi:MAG: ion transporter, partial [Rhodothermia bacterium]
MDRLPDRELSPWRAKLHEIIYEADTPAGKWFDIVLIVLILTSVLIVMLDSVETIRETHGELLYILEWTFTILFSIEYVVRLICVGRPLSYATSFFGVIDLLAILPTYVSLVIPSSRYLLVIRLLRVLRVFRVLKFVQFVQEAQQLRTALVASQRKIFVFFFAVISVVVVLASLMYVIEGAENGFTSIPNSVYWGIVTLTTVGYGDITPQTGLGKLLASIIMLLGYSIIAVPTGIVTVELARGSNRPLSTQACPQCSLEGHDHDAAFCKYCG